VLTVYKARTTDPKNIGILGASGGRRP